MIRLGIELEPRVAFDGDPLRGAAPARDRRRPFVVGWFGRMTAVKRTDDLLTTLAGLRERGVDALLLLVGDGDDRERLEQRAHDLGLARSCLFLGYQEDVAPWYAVCDAVVLTSASEGTPVTIIEALAAGRPVVATEVGGVPDVVDEGETGFLVRPATRMRWRSGSRSSRAIPSARRDGRDRPRAGAAPIRRRAPRRRRRRALPRAARSTDVRDEPPVAAEGDLAVGLPLDPHPSPLPHAVEREPALRSASRITPATSSGRPGGTTMPQPASSTSLTVSLSASAETSTGRPTARIPYSRLGTTKPESPRASPT